MKPPTVGPRIGPMSTPMPQIAMALPRSLASKVSTMIACDTGMTLAPSTPCSRREKTICVSVED